jgi:hypothetical protein
MVTIPFAPIQFNIDLRVLDLFSQKMFDFDSRQDIDLLHPSFYSSIPDAYFDTLPNPRLDGLFVTAAPKSFHLFQSIIAISHHHSSPTHDDKSFLCHKIALTIFPFPAFSFRLAPGLMIYTPGVPTKSILL